MFCNKCGANLPDGSAFCHKCGAKIAYGNAPPPLDEVQSEAAPEKQEQTQTGTENAKQSAPTTEKSEQAQTSTENAGQSTLAPEKQKQAQTSTENAGQSTPAPEKQEQTQTSTAYAGQYTSAPQNKNNSEETSAFREYIEDYLDDFNDLSPIGKVFVILGILLALVVAVVLIKIIFSSALSLVVTLIIAFFAYQWRGAEFFAKKSYENHNGALYLPAGMDNQGFVNALNGNFNYPYFNGIRLDVDGKILIDGKYGTYTANIINGKCALRYNATDNKKADSCVVIREANAIRSYINKFFDTSQAHNAEKDLKKLKVAACLAKADKIIYAGLDVFFVLAILIKLGLFTPGAEVRNAYLTKYNDEVTIGEAFDNYFGKPKWSEYEENGYTYVVFTGVCKFMDESSDVRITFKITGENFAVDTMEFNGQEVGYLFQFALLSDVYDEYEETEV